MSYWFISFLIIIGIIEGSIIAHHNSKKLSKDEASMGHHYQRDMFFDGMFGK